ncbi:unnamed protein product [Rotaria sordida]|uniref:Uncharacterized protein n=1 Tax=Rotaria sordida TaxID=392033 RepID=A0A814A470_9BILA|nr:unnamed protein product [Rotaria sordida]CAF0908280.1 unnamed protein product [Rotaria sordida]CAF0909086.1 unnamed protein product [Rotaria sordida]
MTHLKIQEKPLPCNHPSLATVYNIFGIEKSLPSNRLYFVTTKTNVSLTYQLVNDDSIALLLYDKTFDMQLKFYPFDHLQIAVIQNNIDQVSRLRRNYFGALL